MAKKIKAISDLTPDPHNANLGSERGLGLLDKSLRNLGAGRSIVCDRNGKVIGGNKTLERAVDLGFEIEPVVTKGDKLVVVIREDLDLDNDPKARELAYADNRVGEVDLTWDPNILAKDWENGVDLDWLWTDEELQAIADFAGLDRSAGDDEEAVGDLMDKAEQGQIESRVKLGEIWACGEHRVACCDSTVEANIRKLMGDRKVGFVVADPPYGINIQKKDGTVGGGSLFKGKRWKSKKYEKIAGDETVDAAVEAYLLSSLLFPQVRHVWWGANHYSECFPNSSCWIVWDKQNGGNDFADAELAWTNSPTAVRIFQHLWSGMIRGSENQGSRFHPTQKPIALFEWLYEKYGKPQDLIFDPFLGSGPSIIAAQQMGDRTVYGCELSPQYAEIVLRRWEAISGKTAELAGQL